MRKRSGVDGLMVLPAMVYKSDERETHHALPHGGRTPPGLPIMVYNNPVSYSVDITPEMFARLADEPNLVAIKESSENVRRITDLRNIVGDRYILFGGVDDLVLESILLGAEGWISGLVNAFPDENRALWDLATAGQWEAARELYRWYTPLLHLDTKVKLVQYIKLAMAGDGTGIGDGARAAAHARRRGARRDPGHHPATPSRRGPTCMPPRMTSRVHRSGWRRFRAAWGGARRWRTRSPATIRDMIVAGDLNPGDRIVESRIARQIGVGQPTVREALVALEHRAGGAQGQPGLRGDHADAGRDRPDSAHPRRTGDAGHGTGDRERRRTRRSASCCWLPMPWSAPRGLATCASFSRSTYAFTRRCGG